MVHKFYFEWVGKGAAEEPGVRRARIPAEEDLGVLKWGPVTGRQFWQTAGALA
jgi:hypothetical protein